MSAEEMQDQKATRGHKSATVAPTLRWAGRELPMLLHRGTWRVRSKSKVNPIDISTGAASLAEAKRIAREKLAELPEQVKKPKGTLQNVVELYLAAPKRCSQDTAEGNVSRLRSVARDAFGKTLDQIQISQIPELWPRFVAARQGKAQPDYSTRRSGNHAINSAMKQAASVFLPALRPYYQRQGIQIPADATTIIWTALAHKEPAAADDDRMIAAWETLKDSNPDLWAVIGLARFAGLRQSEIEACRGKWIRRVGEAAYVDLRDWEEDGFFNKTGKRYSAVILHPVLAEYLQSVPPESRVLVRSDATRWIQRVPQDWLRPFTGEAKAPLHRLRGLYADHLKRETEQAMLARMAGIKAASSALGHTDTGTTERHYLTPDGQG